ncbi:hypothetical protein X777_14009 [Ooceraea biroi]|uniref:Uncharacterized protein n=1 Tax=Ooceraea biroi TaxID=2015173 RepID=A0A026WY66_OOCBI|nr:hypothetical protein X777_14009 [Ooceraea biroi]
MIKRITEYSKPKVWCPREDYHLPQDGISMSITSAFPSSNSEKSEIAIYRSTGMKRQDDGTFVLQPSKATVIDAKCYRPATVIHEADYPTVEMDVVEDVLVYCAVSSRRAEDNREVVSSGRQRCEPNTAAKGHVMPAGTGASYRSLSDLGEDVYKSTTIVDQTQTTSQSVLESVKKAFSFASPKVEIRKKDPLIEDRRESVSIVSR